MGCWARTARPRGCFHIAVPKEVLPSAAPSKGGLAPSCSKTGVQEPHQGWLRTFSSSSRTAEVTASRRSSYEATVCAAVHVWRGRVRGVPVCLAAGGTCAAALQAHQARRADPLQLRLQVGNVGGPVGEQLVGRRRPPRARAAARARRRRPVPAPLLLLLVPQAELPAVGLGRPRGEHPTSVAEVNNRPSTTPLPSGLGAGLEVVRTQLGCVSTGAIELA